jgi:hypothetical protein
LSVTNHKNIDAVIVIELNNYRGDNVKFIWQTQGLNIEKESTSLHRIKKVFKANEKAKFVWGE